MISINISHQSYEIMKHSEDLNIKGVGMGRGEGEVKKTHIYLTVKVQTLYTLHTQYSQYCGNHCTQYIGFLHYCVHLRNVLTFDRVWV